MITVNEVVTIDAPIEDVFRFIGHFENTKIWDPGVSAANKEKEGETQVGTTYSIDASFAGRKIPMTYEVTLWKPPTRVVLRGEGPAVIVTDDIRFEASAGTTKIFYRADFSMKGARRFAEPLLKPLFRKLARDAMQGMQTALAERFS